VRIVDEDTILVFFRFDANGRFVRDLLDEKDANQDS